MTDQKQDLGWCILELMGHRRLAGYVTEQEVAGHGFLRIDVPTDTPASQLYSPSAVYAITPTTEEMARRAATLGTVSPVSRWELKALPEVKTPQPEPDEVHDFEGVAIDPYDAIEPPPPAPLPTHICCLGTRRESLVVRTAEGRVSVLLSEDHRRVFDDEVAFLEWLESISWRIGTLADAACDIPF